MVASSFVKHNTGLFHCLVPAPGYILPPMPILIMEKYWYMYMDMQSSSINIVEYFLWSAPWAWHCILLPYNGYVWKRLFQTCSDSSFIINCPYNQHKVPVRLPPPLKKWSQKKIKIKNHKKKKTPGRKLNVVWCSCTNSNYMKFSIHLSPENKQNYITI